MRETFWNKEEKRSVQIVHFGADVEGPPRSVHGGCSAAVVDSAMGQCIWLATKEFAVTANLTVNYRHRIPLGTTAQVESWIVKKEGRKIHVAAKISSLPKPGGGGAGASGGTDADAGAGNTAVTTTYVEATSLFVAKK